MTLAKGAAAVSGVFWIVLLVAVWDWAVSGNPGAVTGIFGAGVGALLWTWIACKERQDP